MTTETKEHRNEKIERMFTFLESVFMNANTETFVQSLQEFYLTKGFLTDKQYLALMDIYERV